MNNVINNRSDLVLEVLKGLEESAEYYFESDNDKSVFYRNGKIVFKIEFEDSNYGIQAGCRWKLVKLWDNVPESEGMFNFSPSKFKIRGFISPFITACLQGETLLDDHEF